MDEGNRESKATAEKPKPNVQGFLDLNKQYSKIDEIPEDELNRVGYTRLGSGHVGPFSVKEQISKKEQKKSQDEKDRENLRVEIFEKKKEDSPFGEIKIELPGESVAYRHLDYNGVTLLLHKYENIKTLSDEISPERTIKTVLSDSPLNTLYENLEPTLSRLFGTEKINYIKMLFSSGMRSINLGQLKEIETDNDLSEKKGIKEKDANDPTTMYLSSKTAEEYFSTLERKKGIINDMNYWYKVFDENMSKNLDQINYLKTDMELVQRLKDHGITNGFSLSTYVFSETAVSAGLETIASKLRNAKNREEVLDILQHTPEASTAALHDEEQEIKKNIRTASLEEKKALSGRLKEIEENRKSRVRTLKGIMDFYTFPEISSAFLKRRINEIQDILVTRSSADNFSSIYINGIPNSEEDKNPGEISGDCTVDRPLPFDDPGIMLYNVKIKTENHNHVGNIYLLETEDDEKNPVWHFEAVQIPLVFIDWKVSMPILLDTIGAEAKKHNVACITVNEKTHLISNYDYIADEIIGIWRNNGQQNIVIDIPSYSYGYTAGVDGLEDIHTFMDDNGYAEEEVVDIGQAADAFEDYPPHMPPEDGEELQTDELEGLPFKKGDRSNFQGDGNAKIIWKNQEYINDQ